MDDWKRLIEHLAAWTSASETGPGRIEVSVSHGAATRQVTIVMTPEEWADMAGVMWGEFDAAVDEVKRTLMGLQPQEGFAVYREYQLEASTESTLPESADSAPEPGGEWVAHDHEDRVASRFEDWSEADEDR